VKPVVDKSKCVSCGACYLWCPESTILFSPGKKADVDYDYCKGCGVCANQCPVGAISMVKEVD